MSNRRDIQVSSWSHHIGISLNVTSWKSSEISLTQLSWEGPLFPVPDLRPFMVDHYQSVSLHTDSHWFVQKPRWASPKSLVASHAATGHEIVRCAVRDLAGFATPLVVSLSIMVMKLDGDCRCHIGEVDKSTYHGYLRIKSHFFEKHDGHGSYWSTRI